MEAGGCRFEPDRLHCFYRHKGALAIRPAFVHYDCSLKSEYADAWDYNNPKRLFAVKRKVLDMSAYLGTASILYPLLCFSKQDAERYRMEPKSDQYTQSKIDMVKLLRVYGGCLGVERR